MGDLLLELLGSGLNSSEQREPLSREDIMEVGYGMHFGGERSCYSESQKMRDMCRHLERGQILTTTLVRKMIIC